MSLTNESEMIVMIGLDFGWTTSIAMVAMGEVGQKNSTDRMVH